MNEGCPHRGEGVRDFCFLMGALRWDGRDARTFIENRFTLFARFCRLQIGRAEHGVNLARSLFVQPKHAQDKSCGLTAEIQSRIGRGQCAGFPVIVSRETMPSSHSQPGPPSSYSELSTTPSGQGLRVSP